MLITLPRKWRLSFCCFVFCCLLYVCLSTAGGGGLSYQLHWLALWQQIIFAARCYARLAYAVMRCLSVCVCLSVCLSRLWILPKWVTVSSQFFHSRVAKPFYFFISYVMAIFQWGPLNRDVECRWGRFKSRLSANIWLSIDDCCS